MDIDDLAIDNSYALGGEDDSRERAQNAAIIEELERKKRLRKMAVPTDDKKVRDRLRAYGHPVTLFGEGPGDRRDRLKYVQEQIQQIRGDLGIMMNDSSDESSDEDEEGEFYTEGPDELLNARRKMAKYSLSKAKARIARQRREYAFPLGKVVNLRKEAFKELKTFNNLGSQFGDDRPLSTIRFSPNSQYLLTTSWTGDSKVWDLPNLNPVVTRRGHVDKIGGAAWHPFATVGGSDDGVCFATGGGEGDVKLWSLAGSDKPLASLSGHSNRVGRLAFHPSGSYLASAGFDGTWRLWDVQTHKELMIQEGHSKEVYALGYQDDGALIASGGFDAIGRVWDLRTGRTAMILDGHVKEILAMDFAPNGQAFSAIIKGQPNQLSALKTQYIIPAHKSSVSDVRFFRSGAELPPVGIQGLPLRSNTGVSDNSGEAMDVDQSHDLSDKQKEENLSKSGIFLVTAGFDCNVRIWSADEWNMVRNLPTDAGKVMSADVSGDGKFVASASYSRSFHLFGGENSL
nr:U4/U6 small nuclear ribonucleoprotein PRP4 [Cryptococcus depauperatus CBS 7855]